MKTKQQGKSGKQNRSASQEPRPSLVRVAVEAFGEGCGDAALHAHVEGGDAALRHRLRKQVEPVHEALSAATAR